MTPCGLPRHRAIVAVDIEDSTSRTDAVKAQLRDLMYTMVEEALESAGITRRHRDPLIDRGDGILALIRPTDQAPKALLLTSVMPLLIAVLRQHDARHPDHYLRLRAVVHAGEVNYDRRGCFGEALDITFRLLDAPVVKRELRQVVSPLILVVSDAIYHSVVRQGYEAADDRGYVQRVNVLVAGRHHRGWIKSTD
jgi:class 3 adenylate cyclase